MRRACILLVVAFLAACGGSDAPTATAPPAPSASATAAASSTSVPTPIPTATSAPTATQPAATPTIIEVFASPVQRRLGWVLDTLLTDPQSIDPADLEDTFTEEFLAEVPADDLLAIAADFRESYGLPQFERYIGELSETEALAQISTGAGADFTISIVVEPDAPYRISGLLISPGQGARPTPVPLEDWQAFDARLAGQAEWVNFLAAELMDGACVPVHAVDAGRPLALGSTFKLYILGELARQVARGTVTWDDELAVRDDLKSLPSGEMQNDPAGTVHALRYLAEQMISISDNTATDHLLAHLGRENVEASQTEMGHSAPELNQPFLSTREMFTIKLALTGENVQRYIDADTQERRRQLAEEIVLLEPALAQANGWTSPRYIDTIEWFASAEDLCRAVATLHELAEQPGLKPVHDILALNPGIAFDPGTWTYIGYKGGSEPGVLNLTWLLQRADGRWFVLTAGLNDPDRNIDLNGALDLLQGAAGLLAGD